MNTTLGRQLDDIVEYGLVPPSFVPPKPIRKLRNLNRYRKAQIEERGREALRLDKEAARPTGAA